MLRAARLARESSSCFPQQSITQCSPQQTETEEQAASILSQDPRLAHREVYCRAEEGRLILRGWVRSFFEKQLVQEALRRLDGVHEIHNELQVRPHLHEEETSYSWAEPEEAPSE